MMLMKHLITYVTAILLLASCVKETDWPLAGDTSQYLVVDGIITNEEKEQEVRLHFTRQALNGESMPVSGAAIIINNEDSTYQLYEDAGEPGSYKSERALAALSGKNYSLLIFYNGNAYSARAAMVPGKTFPELIYKKDGESGLYYIDYVASSFESSDPAMWEILLDWSGVPGYEQEDPDACRRRLLFYTLTTLDVSQVFAPKIEQQLFPGGTLIDQRRYSLTPEHAAFVRSLLLETNWQGGIFPSDPANVSTNLSEGAMGFFGLYAVNSLSLVVSQ